MKDTSLKSYVILRRRDWPSLDALHTSAKRSLEVSTLMGDVQWVRSYVLNEPDGWIGTVCHYRASGPDAIRVHAEQVGIPVDLTSREREVLGLVAEGMRNRDIADRLVLSVPHGRPPRRRNHAQAARPEPRGGCRSSPAAGPARGPVKMGNSADAGRGRRLLRLPLQ
jgi:hypothetical protein